MNLRNFKYNGDVKYLKRHMSGSATLTMPAYNAIATVEVDHNLTYTPHFEIFSNNNKDGIYWTGGEMVEALTDLGTLTGGTAPLTTPIIDYYVTDMKLYIYVKNYTDPLVTGQITIDYIIYV